MDKNLQNIEDLFRKGLEGNEDTPSEDVWDAIDQSLDKASSLRIRRKYYILKWATAFLATGLAAMSIYLLRNVSQRQKPDKAQNENVVSPAAAPKNETVESTKPSPQKINEGSEGQPGNTKAKAFENSNRESEPQTRIPDSQQLATRVNHFNSARTNAPAVPVAPLQQADKGISGREKSVDVLKPNRASEDNKQPPIATADRRQVSPGEAPSQPVTQLNPPPPVTMDRSDLLSLHKKDLKDAATLSPYYQPSRTANHTPIHIAGPPRLNVTVFYSPNIPFSHLRDEDNRFGNPFSREMEKNEKPSYSYSFGVLVDYRLNNKWALETGLDLSTIKMNLEPEKIFAQRDNQGAVKYQINTSSGKGYVLPSFSSNPQVGDSLFTKNISHSLQYTGIPVAAKYYLTNRRLSVNLLAGVSTNILSRGKITTDVKKGNESEHENIHEIHGLKPVYFSGLVGLGLSYHIYRNLSLGFSPMLNFAIEPINKDVPVNSYPGTVNFQVGLKTDF